MSIGGAAARHRSQFQYPWPTWFVATIVPIRDVHFDGIDIDNREPGLTGSGT